MKNFKATQEVLVDGIGKIGVKSFESLVDRIVTAIQPTQAMGLFEKIEKDMARVREGDEMIDRMKSTGYGYALNEKESRIMTCDLLMRELYAHGRLDKENSIYKDAEGNEVLVEPKAYKLDPRFAKKTPIGCSCEDGEEDGNVACEDG
ncbi:hypothetical protein ACH5RR_025723 [Cinchona calisaya]|uniref:Uncharacterized protein n=1 Tax=Cinchona calisaya TaxID=153742 RepID=A0ABD2Z0H1_9GENT